MAARIGIDVGGTFTDFILTRDDAPPVLHKVLSTPADPSIAVVTGLTELAAMVAPAGSVEAFAAGIDTIVHGTTVATNATLTATGAKSALLTTEGVRDALEMRRGVREEQYNNAYTNVKPLVPRHLRIGVKGRLDRAGREQEPLSQDDVRRALRYFQQEGVEAVSICFMNSFANPAHEEAAAALVREAMPDAFLTVSSTLLPSIRFYERLSTTALNSYVGPKLNGYMEKLVRRLGAIDFRGLLLIMQSNGGVMAPEVARSKPALTLLSGPAGGPGAGLFYARGAGPEQGDHHRHGRHQLRGVGCGRCADPRQRRRDRAAQDRAADARHPHHRRGRRLDRLDRSGRSAADGPAQRRCRSRPRVLHEGRHAAGLHRRQPRAGLSRPRLFRRRADAAVGRRRP